MFGNARVLVAALTIAVGVVSAGQVQFQSQAQTATGVTPVYLYDVVSIKPNKFGDGSSASNFVSEEISARNVPLILLVQQAFGFVESSRLSGLPSWLYSERFDVDAKMDPSAIEAFRKLNRDERTLVRHQMLQSLLADRMKLRFHREMKDLPVYSLTVARGGARLQPSKPSSDDPNLQRGTRWENSFDEGMVIIKGERVVVKALIATLELQLHKTVIDHTVGLTGKYDLILRFVPDNGQVQSPGGETPLAAPDPVGPSLISALKDQLGLKLDSTKGPVEIVVIDHIEKPSGN